MKKEKCYDSIKHSGLFWLWTSLFVILADQVTKYLIIQHLDFQTPVRIFPFFNLTLTYNTGAAFGFLHSAAGWQNIFLGALALVVSFIILFWLSRLSRSEIWQSIALCFVLAGALGNLWDRIHHGFVIDFLSFHLGDWYFAIFNVADSAIFIGACMLILSWFVERE